MKKTKLNSSLLTLVLAASASLAGAIASFPASAQDAVRDQTQDRTQQRIREPIYGSQLMTPAEREAHWEKLRNMATEQEREAYRLQHHQQMQERARAKGIQLPDEPLIRRMGPGPGVGGPGPGPGGGAGPMKKM